MIHHPIPDCSGTCSLTSSSILNQLSSSMKVNSSSKKINHNQVCTSQYCTPHRNPMLHGTQSLVDTHMLHHPTPDCSGTCSHSHHRCQLETMSPRELSRMSPELLESNMIQMGTASRRTPHPQSYSIPKHIQHNHRHQLNHSSSCNSLGHMTCMKAFELHR